MILFDFWSIIDFFSMKEFQRGIIRLFEQGKSGYQIAKQKKLEIWSETSSLNASKSTSARSETMENGYRIRPIYVWRTSHYGAFWKTKHVQSPISRSKRWRKVWLRHGTLYLKKSLIKLWTTSRSVWRSALMPKVAILKINS